MESTGLDWFYAPFAREAHQFSEKAPMLSTFFRFFPSKQSFLDLGGGGPLKRQTHIGGKVLIGV